MEIPKTNICPNNLLVDADADTGCLAIAFMHKSRRAKM